MTEFSILNLNITLSSKYFHRKGSQLYPDKNKWALERQLCFELPFIQKLGHFVQTWKTQMQFLPFFRGFETIFPIMCPLHLYSGQIFINLLFPSCVYEFLNTFLNTAWTLMFHCPIKYCYWGAKKISFFVCAPSFLLFPPLCFFFSANIVCVPQDKMAWTDWLGAVHSRITFKLVV